MVGESVLQDRRCVRATAFEAPGCEERGDGGTARGAAADGRAWRIRWRAEFNVQASCLPALFWVKGSFSLGLVSGGAVLNDFRHTEGSLSLPD